MLMLTEGAAKGRLLQALTQREVLEGQPTLGNLVEIAKVFGDAQCAKEGEAAIRMVLEEQVGGEVWEAVARLDCLIVMADWVIEAFLCQFSQSDERSKPDPFEEHMARARPLIDASLGIMLAPAKVHAFIVEEVERRLRREFISAHAGQLFDYILDYPDSTESLKRAHAAITDSPGALGLVWDHLEGSYGRASLGALH